MSSPGQTASSPMVPATISTGENMVDEGDETQGSFWGHSLWQLFILTFRRHLLSRQTLVCLGLTFVLGAIVVAWSLQASRTPKKLADQVLVTTFIGFLMPIFAISYGAASIGGEREDRTLIYLLITPIPRPLIYLIKAAAALLLVELWATTSLAAFCLIAGEYGKEVFWIFLPGVLLGAAAYGSLFLLIGAAFRHGTIISLAYWFFLEVLFGAMPGIVKRMTVSFYVRSWLYDAGSELRLGPQGRINKEMFQAVSGETAILVLSLIVIGLLGAGAWIFSNRSYEELG